MIYQVSEVHFVELIKMAIVVVVSELIAQMPWFRLVVMKV